MSNELIITDVDAKQLLQLKAVDIYSENKLIQSKDNTGFLGESLSKVISQVPAFASAKASHGKALYEVVVNGDLAKAADGNGLRAFVREGGKFKEHAKLFGADKLQNLIAFNACFQAVSFVVGQKHMSDIKNELKSINEKLNDISEFQRNERLVSVEVCYEEVFSYINALRDGKPLNQEIHIDLKRISSESQKNLKHYQYEIKQLIEKKVEHNETFGTSQLTKDLSIKIQKVSKLFFETELALSTVMLCNMLLEVYDESFDAKYQNQQLMHEYTDKLNSFEINLLKEIESIDSITNTVLDFGSNILNSKRIKYVALGMPGPTQALGAGLVTYRLAQSVINESKNSPNKPVMENIKSVIKKEKEALVSPDSDTKKTVNKRKETLSSQLYDFQNQFNRNIKNLNEIANNKTESKYLIEICSETNETRMLEYV